MSAIDASECQRGIARAVLLVTPVSILFPHIPMEASSCPPAVRFLSLSLVGRAGFCLPARPSICGLGWVIINKQTNTRACHTVIRVGTRRCGACREASQVFTASAKQSKSLLGEARLGMEW